MSGSLDERTARQGLQVYAATGPAMQDLPLLCTLQRDCTLQNGLLVQHACIVDQDVHFVLHLIGNVVHCLGVFQITLQAKI